ncbi:hypothetical protein [Streptomyces sp. x-19]|uniref:hypothetical protein n=1 Tax=Streptomyces sp. x-19 TaxID=2789280 RepID=UPI0039818220
MKAMALGVLKRQVAAPARLFPAAPRRSYRQQQEKVTAWREEEHPAIAERAKASATWTCFFPSARLRSYRELGSQRMLTSAEA